MGSRSGIACQRVPHNKQRTHPTNRLTDTPRNSEDDGLISKLYCVNFVLVLLPIISDWTCSSIVNFKSCPGAVPQPQLTALSPDTISPNADSVPITVDGKGFVYQSQILWNGNPLQTKFLDSDHLQATITQQTFESYGGSAGGSALISVMSPGSGMTSIEGCQDGGSSGSLALFID